MMTDRKEFMIKVWLSCKTEDQRRNVENWIQRITKDPLDRDYRDVRDLIDELDFALNCGNGPPDPRDEIKELGRSVQDLTKQVSNLEWRVKRRPKQ